MSVVWNKQTFWQGPCNLFHVFHKWFHTNSSQFRNILKMSNLIKFDQILYFHHFCFGVQMQNDSWQFGVGSMVWFVKFFLLKCSGSCCILVKRLAWSLVLLTKESFQASHGTQGYESCPKEGSYEKLKIQSLSKGQKISPKSEEGSFEKEKSWQTGKADLIRESC